MTKKGDLSMLRHAVIATILPLSLAACGSANNETAAVANNTGTGTGDYLAQIGRMNENERNGVLFRAISDAGRACQGVTRSVSGPAMRGNPSWVATCDDGTPWVVSINDAGIATITPVAPSTPDTPKAG